MRNFIRILAPWAALSAGCWAGTVTAVEEQPGFGGEAELGMVTTSGNTDTRSINAKARLRYLTETWRHEGRLEGLRTSDGDTITAERYLASGKSDYRFTPADYLFVTVRYEDDRFSGYDYQFSEAVGYGRRVVKTESVELDLEIGAGGRHSRESGQAREDEAIVRGAAKLGWAVSPTSRFTEELLVESGESNTYTESVSALSVRINSRFALKLSLTVKHNSDVPAGVEKTDTLSAVTLVYDF
ncbi:MAG: DUF481 domain-containing protein [Pseudomonadota bacterium]